MADFDPDAFLATPSSGGFDPDAFLKSTAPPQQGVGATLASAVTDIPQEIYQAGAAGLHEMNAINPWGQERTEARARGEAPGLMDVPRAVSGAGQLASAVPVGIAHSVGGHLLDLANRGLYSGAVALSGEDKVNKAISDLGGLTGIQPGGGNYQTAKGDVDAMLPALAPGRGRVPVPPTAGPLGVTLSEGQATGALPAIRTEQAALRGQIGPSAEARAKAFSEQQAGQVQSAQNRIKQGFDPYNQTLAETPQDAGQLVSQGVQQAAAARKAGVNDAYDYARSLPGEVHADVFKDIGSRIKDDLSARPEPVIIDDKLTPYASKAIQDIDDRIGQLQIQNRASPTGQPPQNSIMGVTLNGVDQMRKRLSAFRNDAFGTGNATDGRAVKSVLDAFDDQISNAINGGFFTGDKRAVQAWNDARAAHADYRQTFTAQKNDPIGRVIEKITGKTNNPAAIPNDVADFLYGSSGVNPNSLNVGVANRVKGILGDQSPEWAGVKQGLFSRLVETPPGMTDPGSAKIAQRLNKFLNGDGQEMASAVFSPDERKLLQQYADLHRQLEVPPTGANRSETSTFVAPMLRKIGTRLGMVMGAGLGHVLAPGLPWGVSEAAGAGVAKGIGAVGNAMDARQISKQMPLIAQTMKQYQRQLAASVVKPRTLAIAGTNLANALRPLGIDLGAVQGALPAGAGEQNQQGPGRGANQPNGGVPGQPQGFAHGGRVEPKLSHKAVGYVTKSRIPGKHCSVCSMYLGPNQCSLVSPPIEAKGYCRRFRRGK